VNVFDVLMYLFENYLYDGEPHPDRDSLESELSQAGFDQPEIHKAFDWLDGLQEFRRQIPLVAASSHAIRVFTDEEMRKLDADCRGFMLFLEQVGILTPASRELVIDRVMALQEDEVDLDTLKWIILMVLFKSPGEEEAFASMENLLFEGPTELLH